MLSTRLKTLDIYKELMENPKAQVVDNTQEVVLEICATNMHTISISMLHTEQKQDKMCTILVLQWFKSITMSASGTLQKHQYIHGLQHNVTIAPCSSVPTILHEFHFSKGHREPSIHFRQ